MEKEERVEDRRTTSFKIKPSVKNSLKVHCFQNGISISEFLEDIIKQNVK